MPVAADISLIVMPLTVVDSMTRPSGLYSTRSLIVHPGRILALRVASLMPVSAEISRIVFPSISTVAFRPLPIFCLHTLNRPGERIGRRAFVFDDVKIHTLIVAGSSL